MKVSVGIDDSETLARLNALSVSELATAWTEAVRRLAQENARNKIGGDFGNDVVARAVDAQVNADGGSVFLSGANDYIAAHVHTGGTIRPRNARYLAIPIDRSVKGLFAREVPGLVFLRKPGEGPNGRAFLARPEGKKGKLKPLFVLKTAVTQRPRPWWPDDAEIQDETLRFFAENL